MFIPLPLLAGVLFIIVAVVLIIRKSKGKKELNKETVSEERIHEPPAGETGTDEDKTKD
jgi:hypothetical protein